MRGGGVGARGSPKCSWLLLQLLRGQRGTATCFGRTAVKTGCQDRLDGVAGSLRCVLTVASTFVS
jgi:hypothetical protein